MKAIIKILLITVILLIPIASGFKGTKMNDDVIDNLLKHKLIN